MHQETYKNIMAIVKTYTDNGYSYGAAAGGLQVIAHRLAKTEELALQEGIYGPAFSDTDTAFVTDVIAELEKHEYGSDISYMPKMLGTVLMAQRVCLDHIDPQ